MQVKQTPADRLRIEKIRTEQASFLGPAFLGVAATLASSAIFTIGTVAGFHNPFLQACGYLVPVASIVEALACIALVVDRSRAREHYYNRTAFTGMMVATVVFVAAAAQWYIAQKYYTPELVTKLGRGVILLGHGTWASILAFLGGSPTHFMVAPIGEDEVITPIVETLDEKTPLKAILISNAPRL